MKSLVRTARADPVGVCRTLVRRKALAAGLWRRDGRSAAPRVISLKLTDNCNLRCIMCDQFGPTGTLKSAGARRAAMSSRSLDRLLGEVARWKPSVYLTGGEPMLHPEIIPVVERVTRKHRLFCEINTNGTLLGQKARELVQMCGLDVLTISVHGPNAEVNDAVVRVAGFHEKMVASIRAVREAREEARSDKPLIRLNCVITSENWRDLEAMVGFAEDAGADQLNFQHPMYTTSEMLATHKAAFEPLFGTSSPDLVGYLNAANGLNSLSLFLLLDVLRTRSSRIPVTFYPKVHPSETAAYYREPFHRFKLQRCVAPWERVTVLPNGDMTPCLGLIIGNAFAEGFLAAWNSDRFVRFRQALGEKGLFPGCLRCCHRLYQ